MLNEILDKFKTHGDKRGLEYINKDETPFNVETMFFKGRDEIPNQTKSPKKASLCTHCKKIGRSQFRCYTMFLERFGTQMNRLMNDFNFLKYNILNNGKGNKINQKPKSQPSSSKSPPRTKQVWLRNNRPKYQGVFNALKTKSSSKWYLNNGCSRHMTCDKIYFTSLENYNGGIVTFGDVSLA